MYKVTTVLCALLLTACSNYQFGDVTKGTVSAVGSVMDLKATYCDIENDEKREFILSVIRSKDPAYTGVCDEG